MIITSTVRDQKMQLEVYLKDDGYGFPKIDEVKDLMDKDIDLSEEDERRVLADAIEYDEDGIGQSMWSDINDYTGS
jgi:hypothetical protein